MLFKCSHSQSLCCRLSSSRYGLVAAVLLDSFGLPLAGRRRAGSFPFLPFSLVFGAASFLVSLSAECLGLELVPVSLDAFEPGRVRWI